jgi:cell division protease FtsH
MVNKKNNKKNPKVNPYWVYGGVIFLFILFQTFSGGLASKRSQ